MSKVVSNAAQTFNNWFQINFNPEIKKAITTALKKGLTPVYEETRRNILNSNIKHSNEMLGGAVIKTGINRNNNHYSKVTVLGNGGKGNLLRIFELGSYKKPNCNIKAYKFLTNTNSSMCDALIISNLQDTIKKLNNGK